MRVDSGGVGLHVDVSGPEDGPAVVLLHGFPDTGRLWAKQVPALAGAGYRVIVPDLRGYGKSDKPADVDAYNLLFLAADVGAVLDAAGVQRAHVVGHDWGAAVAWGVASFAPDRVDHLAVLSVGHPSSFAGAGLEQREKSWYMLLFQFEGIAEQWLSADGWANLRELGAAILTAKPSSPNWKPTAPLPRVSTTTGPTSMPGSWWSRRSSCRRSPCRPWACGAPGTSP